MSIITKMLKETGVYWSPLGTDAYGQPTYNSPIEISVRWQDVTEEFLDPDGETQIARSKVFVGQDVVLRGVLFLGLLTDLTSTTDPKANIGAWEIRLFKRIPNFKATEWLRIALL